MLESKPTSDSETSSPLPAKAWSLSPEEALGRLEVNPEQGLSRAEARRRLHKHGPNQLQVHAKRPAWRILLGQFTNLIIALLAAAGALSLAFGQGTEAVAIAVAIGLNTAIGFFTELRAARSMESLRRMGQTTARVIRGGKSRELAAAELVPGDVVELEAGDVVPADLRLLEANGVEADEAALTGESMPVPKELEASAADAPLAERRSMLFKGTSLTAGSGLGLVMATGQGTELGRVAQLTQEAAGEEASPLQRRLARLARRLVWLTLAVTLAVGLAGWLAERPWLLIVETAVALAVAAIPEGLPMVATIALARGMWRMARRHAIMNRLSAVETLGSTTIICSDKTGTLTANQMEMARWLLPDPDGQRQVEAGEEPPLEQDQALRLALEAGVLCANANLDDQGHAVGDPLEAALLRAGRRVGLERAKLLQELPEVREEAFDAQRKMMATVHRENSGYRVTVKGAPEAVLEICDEQWSPDGQRELDQAARQAWQQANQEMAAQGLRVIALAQRQAQREDEDPYQGLTLLGLAGLWDPPRQDAAEAIEACRRLGIRLVMVTGDQAATAGYIGRKLGLVSQGDDGVISGEELDQADTLDQAARERLRQASILARVSPEQKLKLITLHQEAGDIVAMTGDGVNDAPALKKADIGVAMGKRGTQVAQEAADMILTDDSLASIVAAVRQGRTIFRNIRRFIVYLLSGNMAEIMAVAIAILAGWPLPLLPLQILYLNMIGDVFPALALGVGRGDPNGEEERPRRKGEAVLAATHWWAVVGWGGLIAGVVLATYAVAARGLGLGPAQAVTVSFLSLAFARLWHVFNMRRPSEAILLNTVTRNPMIWAALGLCSVLLLAAEFLAPLRTVLGMAPLPAAGWWLVAMGSLAPLAVGQVFIWVLGFGKKRS